MHTYITKFLGIGLMAMATSVWAEPHVGVQAGVGVTNFNAPSGITADNIAGFAAGVVVEVPMDDMISIQPELNFMQRGANLAGNGATNVTSRVNSLELPIFLKLGFGKAIRVSGFAGPNFSFALSSSLDVNAGGSMGSLTFSQNAVDFGAALGGGIDVGPFFGNIRYMLGLVNVNNSGATWNSRGFLAMVGLKF